MDPKTHGVLLARALYRGIVALNHGGVHCSCRSLSSKVVSQYSSLLSPMAVDAVLRVIDPARPTM